MHACPNGLGYATATIRTTIHDLYRRDPDHRLTVEQLYGMLIARSQRCTPEQVTQALAYLAHPLVGELVWHPDQTFVLAVAPD